MRAVLAAAPCWCWPALTDPVVVFAQASLPRDIRIETVSMTNTSVSEGAAGALKLPRGRIELVEVARGLAALAVVFVHGASGMSLPQYSGRIPFSNIFGLGFMGVDFFFVLSGFIILYVHFNDIDRPTQAKRYVWRRLVRIFPTYWIIFALFLAFNLLVQRDKVQITGLLWFPQEMLLLKSHLWLGVAWTLQHEMLFYTLFILLILNRRLGVFAIAGWMAMIIALKFIAPHYHDYVRVTIETTTVRSLDRILFHPQNLDFLYGMIIAFCLRRTPHFIGYLGLAFAAVFVACAPLVQWPDVDMNSYWRYPWAGLGFASLLCAILFMSARVPRVPAFLTFLGTISYSLYLSHLMPISTVLAALSRLGWYQQIPEALIFTLAVASAILFASLCYRYLEKPLMQRLQTLVA
jgi:exopolysaccharide production protein ExoZ